MKHYNISDKLAIVFMCLLIFMGIGGTVGIFNAFKIDEVNKGLYKTFFKRNDFLMSAESEFLTMHQQTLLYIDINDNNSKRFLKEEISNHSHLIKRLLFDYEEDGLDLDSQNLIEIFDQEMVGYKSNQIEIFSIKGLEKFTILEKSNLKSEITVAFNDTFTALNNIIRQERIVLNRSYLESEKLASLTLIVTILLAMGAIVFAFIVWYFLSKSIVKPLLSIGEAARHMALGDFKHRAPVLSNDEIGSLAVEFNKMASDLENIYSTLEKKVKERTEFLNDANIELSKKQIELEEKNVELLNASEMKSHFLANVSHELRTPLNSIIGFSELLQESTFGDLNEKQLQYVQYINSSGMHLLQLINEILDLTKIEAGMLNLLIENFTITDIIEDVLGSVAPLAEKKKVKINSKNSNSKQIISADKSKFKQILLNLISNAIKFNQDGGKVDIAWRETYVRNTSYVEIVVADTGIGIKKENMGKMFKEFEQLDPSITREYGGTGLGLALSRKLVELHDGNIKVESIYGTGTTFTFVLPVIAEKLSSDSSVLNEKYELPEDTSNKNSSVLICAESVEEGGLIKAYLNNLSFDLMIIRDGITLEERVRISKPAVIVLGINIEGKNGLDVLNSLSEDGSLNNVSVVIVSADDMVEAKDEYNIIGVLNKPDKDEIVKLLKGM